MRTQIKSAGRIDLSWGGGHISVLLDVRAGSLTAYHGGEQFHHQYGGKNYYKSLSGLSGAGWIPARPWLKALPTYRVDLPSPSFRIGEGNRKNENPCTLPDLPEKVFGQQIWAPIDYRGSTSIPWEYPVILEKGDGSFVALKQNDLGEYLRGEIRQEELGIKEVGISYYPNPSAAVTTQKYRVMVRKGSKFLKLNRALEGRNIQDLAFSEGEEMIPQKRFYTRLGLYEAPGFFFKVTGSIARKRYTQEELSTVEALQSAAPANVAFLATNCYLQEVTDGRYEAVVLFEIEGEKKSFEMNLSQTDAIRAMAGNPGDVIGRLHLEAEESARRARELAQQPAPEPAPAP